MRIPITRTLLGALALVTLLALPAPVAAAPIDFDTFAETAQAALIWDIDYGNLNLSRTGESDFYGTFNTFFSALSTAGGASYHIGDFLGEILDGSNNEQRVTLPPPISVTDTPGHTVYRFPAGAIWNINGVPIYHGDGTSHVGSFSATFDAFTLNTYEIGGYGFFFFHHGQWDPITAALLGLPGHEIYGMNAWFLDFNEPDFGQDERKGRLFGDTVFKVPEPGLGLLLLGGGLAAWRRRRVSAS